MKRSFVAVAAIVILLGVGYLFRYPIFQFLTTPGSGGEEGQQRVELPDAYRFAVSIDNSLSARPQTGLSKADVVFEVPAEGGFTRYLALFQNQQSDRISPVRSARPYFLDWVLGWDAIMVHSGGSREALERVKSDDRIKDIDEFFNSDYIKRDSNRPAPSNLYTSTELLTSRAERAGWSLTSPSYGWDIKADNPTQATSTVAIEIDFGNPAFASSYEYDRETNSYLRFLAEDPHIDRGSNKQIAAKNIVVIETTSRVIDQNLLTIDLVTEGSGRATIFRDGEVLRARWRKQGETGPLEILDADGSKVAMNQGQVWIEVIDQLGTFSWQ